MAFHFPLMPRMFMAVRQEDRHPIVEILRQTPDIPETCQWGIFLRNHDELTLEMVTDEERDYMYQWYAADPQMRINGGIRRRLAPLMENSRRRIELMNSLLFSLPGTPVIYYGDEIGMGDNIYLGDRNSRADADAVDRRSQRRLLARRRRAALRAAHHRSGLRLQRGQRRGAGTVAVLAPQLDEADDRAAQAAHRLWPRHHRVPARARTARCSRMSDGHENETVLCVANLSRSMQPVELDLSRFRGMLPIEMLGQTEFPSIGDQPYFLSLGAYGFIWFRLQQAAPADHRTNHRRTRPRPRRSRWRCLSARCGTRCSMAPSARSSNAICSAVPAAPAVVPGHAARDPPASRTGACSAAGPSRSSSPSSKPSSTIDRTIGRHAPVFRAARDGVGARARRRCRSNSPTPCSHASPARARACWSTVGTTIAWRRRCFESVVSGTDVKTRAASMRATPTATFPQLRRATDTLRADASVVAARALRPSTTATRSRSSCFRRAEPGMHPEVELTRPPDRDRLLRRPAARRRHRLRASAGAGRQRHRSRQLARHDAAGGGEPD